MKRLHSNRRAALALLAPTAAYAAFRFAIGIGPADAPASSSTADTPAPIPTVAPLTAAQARAAQWLKSRQPAPHYPSPLIHPEPEPIVEPQPAPPAPAQEASDPAFEVRSIIGTGERAIVSINGRAYRLGGEPEPGWKITAIDGPAKRVTITGPTGKSIELSVADRRIAD